MATKQLYTKPIIVRQQDGEWYVFFRYWNNLTNQYQRFKCSEGLNRIKNKVEKEAEFRALREARELWLKMGWNPIKDREFIARHTIVTQSQLAHIGEWTVEKALFHAVEHKKLAPKSRYDYKKSAWYFIEAAKKLFLHVTPVKDLQRSHCKAIFSILINQFNLSNKNHNKRLEHVKSLLSELVEWDALPLNPAFGIKELPEEQTVKFIPPTKEERLMIAEYVYTQHYRFYIFFLTIYYTGVRPDEILGLKVSDIDLQDCTIHLNPISEVVKNRKERRPPIHPNLIKFYREMNLHEYPDAYYVFSDKFLPGPKRQKRVNATNLWKKLVWEELGIHKYMYSLKHAGADDLIEAGVDESHVVDHLGHSQKFMTRRYTLKGVEQAKQAVMKANINF